MKVRKTAASCAKILGESRQSLDRAAVSEAAAFLSQRMIRKKGKRHMGRIGSKGATSYWNSMTPTERRLELRRRAVVRRKNRVARIKASIEA